MIAHIALGIALLVLAVITLGYYRQTVRDQGHSYGKPSRFLAEPLQHLFQTRVPLTTPRNDEISTGPRIEVFVDALFA